MTYQIYMLAETYEFDRAPKAASSSIALNEMSYSFAFTHLFDSKVMLLAQWCYSPRRGFRLQTASSSPAAISGASCWHSRAACTPMESGRGDTGCLSGVR